MLWPVLALPWRVYELRLDWAPGKGPDTNEQAAARLDALDLIGQAKAAIDRAKRGRHGDTPGSTSRADP